MKKCVARVNVTDLEMMLCYSLVGNRKEGYGIEIVQTDASGVVLEVAAQKVTYRRDNALKFARVLAQGVVFPYSLQDVISEWDFFA